MGKKEDYEGDGRLGEIKESKRRTRKGSDHGKLGNECRGKSWAVKVLGAEERKVN